MKRVFIDLTNLLSTTFISGIQRVVREVITRVYQDNELEYIFVTYRAKTSSFCSINCDKLMSQLKNGRLNARSCVTNKEIRIDEIGEGDILFDIDGVWLSTKLRGVLYPQLHDQGARIVNMIYDIIPITVPQYCHEITVISFLAYFGAVLSYSDFIMANTQATIDKAESIARQMNIMFPDSAVVPLGADFGSSKSKGDAVISRHVRTAAEKGRYVLMVGTIEPRKNHRYLIDALNKGLPCNVIIAGRKGWNVEQLIRDMESNVEYGKKLFWINDATDDDISYLYENAYYVVFPSHEEGYGLPIIESIMRGTPIIASDIPVLREVGGEYADYLDKDDPMSLVTFMNSVITDKGSYENRKKRLSSYVQFTWDECAELVSGYLRNV